MSGRYVSTQTDERGAYAFASLPPGKYSIEFELSPGFTPAGGLAVAVSGGDACRVDTFATADGQIEGTIVDSIGNPLAGFVTIERADPSIRRPHRSAGLAGSDVAADGKFALQKIPPPLSPRLLPAQRQSRQLPRSILLARGRRHRSRLRPTPHDSVRGPVIIRRRGADDFEAIVQLAGVKVKWGPTGDSPSEKMRSPHLSADDALTSYNSYHWKLPAPR
jgi:hypothetical protein